jgi:hypothetical protein
MRAAKIIITIGALVTVAGIALTACGASGATNSPAVSTTPVAEQSQAPDMTTGQQNAVQSAQSYLDMGSGFSQAGLMEQLTSTSGEGFSKADATFAINNIKPDWNEQAVLSAKGYMKMGGFSRASLLEQLTSKAGAGFTQAQALHALKAVGY